MKFVGAHVSAAGGVENAVYNAKDISAKAFALFVKNQMQWFSKDIGDSEISEFNKRLKDVGISKKHILPHSSYLVNLGSPSNDAREQSLKSLIFELNLCKKLGITSLNIHPGSHLREISEEECLDNIAQGINACNKNVPEVVVVLENTAGQGSNVGYKLEHLKRIIDGVDNKKLVGICIDTCHSFAAGYDLRTIDGSKSFFDQAVDMIGLKYLKGLHLNDSKTDFCSRKDRHESLGKGFIGLEVFKYIMNTYYFDDIPLILETVDPTIWSEEIKLLYDFII